MSNSEWLAQLRAQDIPRRPPHTQRPGEQTQPTVLLQRRVVIPMAALEQAQNESIAEELGLPLDPQPSSYTPAPTTLAPVPETQPSAPPEATKMAAKRSTARSHHDDEYKIAAVARMLEKQRKAMEAGSTMRGLLNEAARAAGVTGPSFKGWMHNFRKEAAKLNRAPEAQQTLLSRPSEPVSAAGPLAPVTCTLNGLEAYVNALVDKRIKERLAAMLGGG